MLWYWVALPGRSRFPFWGPARHVLWVLSPINRNFFPEFLPLENSVFTGVSEKLSFLTNKSNWLQKQKGFRLLLITKF